MSVNDVCKKTEIRNRKKEKVAKAVKKCDFHTNKE